MDKPKLSEMDFRNQQQYKADTEFNSLIESLGIKYGDYFAARPSRIKGEESDNIKNAFMLIVNNGIATLVWESNSNISEEIKSEIEHAFKQAYPM